MVIKSPHFGFYSFTTGETYSAQIDRDRFQTIDNSFAFLSEVIGDGIITGFEILEDENVGSSITVGPGTALIDKISTRTFITKRINLPDNRISYIYIRRRIDTIGQFSGFSDFYTLEFEDKTIPLTPSNFQVSGLGDYNATMSWYANDFDLDFFEVHRRSGVEEDFLLIDTVLKQEDVDDISFSDISVGQNSSYSYKIRSVDLSGNMSLFTESIDIVTLQDLSEPDPPFSIKINSTDGSAQIMWDIIDNDMISYVQIRYHAMSVDGSQLNEDVIVNVDKNRLNYVFLNLSNSSNYRSFIKTVSINGVSSVEIEKILEPRSSSNPEDVTSIFVDTVLWSGATSLQVEWIVIENDDSESESGGVDLSPYHGDPYVSEEGFIIPVIDIPDEEIDVFVKIKITQFNPDGTSIESALMATYNPGLANFVEFNTVPDDAGSVPDTFPILPNQLYLVSIYRVVNGALSHGRFFYITTKDFVPPPPVENISLSVSSDSSIEALWNVQIGAPLDLSDVVDYDLIVYEYPILAVDDSGNTKNAIKIRNKIGDLDMDFSYSYYLYRFENQTLYAELNPFYVAGQSEMTNPLFIPSFQIDSRNMTIGELGDALSQIEIAPSINGLLSSYVDTDVSASSADRSTEDIFQILTFPYGDNTFSQSLKVIPVTGQNPDVDVLVGEPTEIYNGTTGGAAYFRLTPDIINISSKYEFNIRSIDSSGNVSLYESSFILIRSADFFDRPGYPRNTYAAPGDGLVMLSWSPPQDYVNLEYFSIYRADAQLGVVADNFIKIDTVGSSVSQYVDYTAQNDITYVYLITSVTYYGLESINPVADGIIGSALVHMTPRVSGVLASPYNLTVSVYENDVVLEWDFIQDSFDGFEIYKSIDSKMDFEVIDTVPGTIGNYRDVNGLTNTGAYRYMVRKVINEGDIGFTELNELPSFSEFIASISISDGNITIDNNFGRYLGGLRSPITEVTKEVTDAHRHYMIGEGDDRRVNFAGGVTIDNWTTGANDGKVWTTDTDLLSIIDFESIVSDVPVAASSSVDVDEVEQAGGDLHCGGIGGRDLSGDGSVDHYDCYRCYRGIKPGFYLFEGSDLFCPYWSDAWRFGEGYSMENRDPNISGFRGGGYCDHNISVPGSFDDRQCNPQGGQGGGPIVPVPYNVYIDGELARMLYDIDMETGTLTFEKSLAMIPGTDDIGVLYGVGFNSPVVFPEVKVVFDSEEVKEILPASLVESVSATQFTKNQLTYDSIPNLQHDGRVQEDLIPLRVRMSTLDGYSYYGVEDEDGVVLESSESGNVTALQLWSTDGEIGSGPAPIIFYDLMYFSNANVMWAASSIGVIYSEDFGVTWGSSNRASVSTSLAPHTIFRSTLYNKVFTITNRSVFVSPVPGDPIGGEDDGNVSPSGSFSEISGIAAASAIRDVMEVSSDQVSIIGSGLKITKRPTIEVNLFEFRKNINVFESNGIVDFTDDLGFQIPVNNLTLLELAQRIRDTLVFRIGSTSVYMKDLYDISVDENVSAPSSSMLDTDWIVDDREIDFQVEVPYLDPRSGVFFSTNLGIYRLRYDAYGVSPILTQRPIFGAATTNAYAMLNDKEYGRFLISTDAGLIETTDGADTFFLTDDIPDQVPIYSFVQEGDYIFAISGQHIYRRDPGRKDFIEIFYTENFFMRKAEVHYGKLYITSSDGLMVNGAEYNPFSSSQIKLIHASGVLSKNGKNLAIHSIRKFSDKLFIGSENSMFVSTSSSLIYRHWEMDAGTIPTVYVNDEEQKIGWYLLNYGSGGNAISSLSFDEKYDSNDSISVARQYSRFKAKNGGWVDQDFASIVLMYINGFRVNDGSRAEKPIHSIQEEVGSGISITDTISHLEGANKYLDQLGLMRNLLISNEIELDGTPKELGYLNFTRQNVRTLHNLIDKFNSQTFFTDPRFEEDVDITEQTKTSLPKFKVYLTGGSYSNGRYTMENLGYSDFGDYPEEPMIGSKTTLDDEDRSWLILDDESSLGDGIGGDGDDDDDGGTGGGGGAGGGTGGGGGAGGGTGGGDPGGF